ncbi:MAG: rhomboid family intramembrane serine protease [Deltaproteobacteria bacterium]|nr:rhomboid family intramembrane serine protease [Deltaproteobacteria bacterium]
MATRKGGSILCPNCGRLIGSDELRCPHCGLSSPGSWWKNNIWTRGFRNADQVVRAIIYTNVAIYAISVLLYPRAWSLSFNPFSFLSPTGRSLLLLGATGTIPIDRLHRWWTLLSANYIHGGLLHILFNMFALRQLGGLVAQEYGIYRMVVIYTLGGVIGFLVSYLAGVRLTIGASAAVCSLIGAVLYYGKSRGGSYGQTIFRQIGGWAVGIFLFGILMPGIDNWAHGGGILAGVFLGFSLGYHERSRESFSHKILAGICIVLTLAILGWAVLSSIYYRIAG